MQAAAQPPAAGLAAGNSFFFRINGVDVFAKGSNLIPLDVFAPAVNASQMQWLLARAAAANMNMIRVWGGGRYQPESFYELADEMGLMIWQEMIFACALYPRDEPQHAEGGRLVAPQPGRLDGSTGLRPRCAHSGGEAAV